MIPLKRDKGPSDKKNYRFLKAEVSEVSEDSPLLGSVLPGDFLLEINGIPPRDIIDYLILQDDEKIDLLLERKGKEYRVKIAKEEGFPLGLSFRDPLFDGVITCRNNCIFCFVDQLPPGLRPSLYLKDDDYRLSFLEGNFITLTGLPKWELKRICSLRLSPLYYSLHSTDADLRDYMMGTKSSRRSLQDLRHLMREGIEIHLQVVLCPGVNDGRMLEMTFQEVLDRYPAASLGVVPVGLTKFNSNLRYPIAPVEAEHAQDVLEIVERFQRISLRKRGKRFFFAADEFYLMLGETFPGGEEYEGYPQLENGIGLSRKFIDAFRAEGRRRGAPSPEREVTILTGKLGEEVLRIAWEEAGFPSASNLRVRSLRNIFLGESITVSGLISGTDIIKGLEGESMTRGCVIIPENMLREGLFLDGMTLEEVSSRLGKPILPVPVNGKTLVDILHKANNLNGDMRCYR